jgi:hypothetical protein
MNTIIKWAWAVALGLGLHATVAAQTVLPNLPVSIRHFRAEKTDGATGVFHAADSVVFKYRLVNRSSGASLAVHDTVQIPVFYSVLTRSGDTLVPRDTLNVHTFANISFSPSSTIGSFERRTKISKLRIVSGGGVIIVWPGVAQTTPGDTVHFDINVAVDTSNGTSRRAPEDQGFDVYPVPAVDLLTIEAPAPITHAVLTDLSGKTWGRYAGQWQTRLVLDASSLPSGVYVLHWRSADGREATRRIAVR